MGTEHLKGGDIMSCSLWRWAETCEGKLSDGGYNVSRKESTVAITVKGSKAVSIDFKGAEDARGRC